MTKRMTNKQRFIAAATKPTLGGYSTREEVRTAKKLARGKFWCEKEYMQFCAFSPSGRRKFFSFDNYGHYLISRDAAKLWARGKYKESQELYPSSDIGSDVK